MTQQDPTTVSTGESPAVQADSTTVSASDASVSTYNGWTDRETWALNLWLQNDEGLYSLTRERVADWLERYPEDAADDRLAAVRAGEAVKEFWEELTDPAEGLMTAEAILEMVRDIGSEYRVNWDEIGAFWVSDAS